MLFNADDADAIEIGGIRSKRTGAIYESHHDLLAEFAS
ncbi:hypothetical protein PLANPX_3942 [Lacipirellula parvula]|uniref:Uncharacterized protein n=1 Tax=Lacipirellula parvula TaxID=2650471 RepID=A0A5K7XBZ0_9BACT|nr:hypothetical protein PLANPX_3942 [Lacipirellula parvula]